MRGEGNEEKRQVKELTTASFLRADLGKLCEPRRDRRGFSHKRDWRSKAMVTGTRGMREVNKLQEF